MRGEESRLPERREPSFLARCVFCRSLLFSIFLSPLPLFLFFALSSRPFPSLSIFLRSRPRLWPLMFFIKLTLAARASALLSAGLPCLHNIVYNSARAEFHFIPTAIVRRRLPGSSSSSCSHRVSTTSRRGRPRAAALANEPRPTSLLSLFLSRSLDFYPPRWRGQPRVSAPSVFILARKSSGAHIFRAPSSALGLSRREIR